MPSKSQTDHQRRRSHQMDGHINCLPAALQTSIIVINSFPYCPPGGMVLWLVVVPPI